MLNSHTHARLKKGKIYPALGGTAHIALMISSSLLHA